MQEAELQFGKRGIAPKVGVLIRIGFQIVKFTFGEIFVNHQLVAIGDKGVLIDGRLRGAQFN